MKAFSQQHGITFPLLADVGSATIKRYGILNTVAMELTGPNAKDPALADNIKTFVSAVGASPRMAGIAFPGTFILDRRGRVTSRFFEDFYIDRNTVSSILMRAGAGPQVAGTKVAGAHVDLTAYPSDSAIAPGNRITLAFNVVPHPGVHVYAPGADKQGYRPIAVRLDPSPLVQVLPPVYPPSEIYVFQPLNERVPVYQKPFTLLQDIVLQGTQQAQQTLRGQTSITIKGSVDYQACDDKVCFNPESVPLSWTFTLRSIVFERPTPNR
jgi:Thiol:disulfide interchange protein DsbD, N-terminal/AhpC/TSA family